MTYFPPPIDVTYEQLKKMLNVGGVDNLELAQVHELLLLLPCFVMTLRERVMEAFKNFKQAKSLYQSVLSDKFLQAEGSVEVRKMKASIDPDVMQLEQDMNLAEATYEYVRTSPNDWLELQQALKRLCDNK
jgi:hypothetical protein